MSHVPAAVVAELVNDAALAGGGTVSADVLITWGADAEVRGMMLLDANLGVNPDLEVEILVPQARDVSASPGQTRSFVPAFALHGANVRQVPIVRAVRVKETWLVRFRNQGAAAARPRLVLTQVAA